MNASCPPAPRALQLVEHRPDKVVPCIELYNITPDRRHRLRIRSSAVLSIHVHLKGNRPVPCWDKTGENCEHHHLDSFRQHYVYVSEIDRVRVRLLRLTSGLLYEVCPGLLEKGRDLNGIIVELWRESPVDKASPMLGEIVEDEPLDRAPCDAPDLSWSVNRLLGATKRVKPWVNRRTGRSAPAPKSAESNASAATTREVNNLAKAAALMMRGQSDAANKILASIGAGVDDKEGTDAAQ